MTRNTAAVVRTDRLNKTLRAAVLLTPTLAPRTRKQLLETGTAIRLLSDVDDPTGVAAGLAQLGELIQEVTELNGWGDKLTRLADHLREAYPTLKTGASR